MRTFRSLVAALRINVRGDDCIIWPILARAAFKLLRHGRRKSHSRTRTVSSAAASIFKAVVSSLEVSSAVDCALRSEAIKLRIRRKEAARPTSRK